MRWVLLNIVTLEIRTPVHSNCVLKIHQRAPPLRAGIYPQNVSIIYTALNYKGF